MKTIIDTAELAGAFTTLLKALTAASLNDNLRGAGPFTVFAPTDDAFKRLAAGRLDALLADVPKLKAILSYHVVAGRVAAKDIRPGELKTLEGSALAASVKDGRVAVDGHLVLTPDIAASNGVIHVIDTVLMPPSARLANVA